MRLIRVLKFFISFFASKVLIRKNNRSLKSFLDPYPRKSLKKKPGKTIVVTTFFNPAHYDSYLKNYKKFREKLREQSVVLLTMEVAFGEDSFYLKKMMQIF